MGELDKTSSRVKPLVNLLHHVRDCLLQVLEIDEEPQPEIELHIEEKTRRSCAGFYCHEQNIVALNIDLVREGFNELVNSIWEKKQGNVAERLRGPKMAMLVRTLAHELKHRQQHLVNDESFNHEFEIEDNLDLSKDDDYKTYKSLNIEADARTFSRVGAAIVLEDWESFWQVDSEDDSNNETYKKYLAINTACYRRYIPNEVFKKIMEE